MVRDVYCEDFSLKKRKKYRGLAKDLKRLLPGESVRTDREDLFAYAGDATRDLVSVEPDAVVLPRTEEEVSAVLAYASRNGVPVTPRGAGSGLSGGCTPVMGGIVLDMKRMNRIIDINRGNMTATAEGGVVLAAFQKAVEDRGLFYPPDPQSKSVCTLGGNVATRAGGPRGVKYGTTPHYILGLTAVLPDGSLIEAGGTCVKQSVGYDITHLLTGSEGTLGVVTRVNTRLIPLPEKHRTIIVACETPEQASRTVSEIIAEGAVPAILEYLNPSLVENVINPSVSKPIPPCGACLMMELDGTASQIEDAGERIREISNAVGAVDVRIVEDDREAKAYWDARSRLYPIMVAAMKKVIPEDITVPRDRIPELITTLGNIAASFDIDVSIVGHAGDGNMHPTLLLPETGEEIEARAKAAVERMIMAGLRLGGSISGEHGVGLHKSEFLALELGDRQVELLKAIKSAFDPTGIMNPGKIWYHGG